MGWIIAALSIAYYTEICKYIYIYCHVQPLVTPPLLQNVNNNSNKGGKDDHIQTIILYFNLNLFTFSKKGIELLEDY